MADEPTPVEEPTRELDAEAALIAALAAAQAAFPKIEKTQTATVTPRSGKPGYTYSYADLGDVLGQVRPVLAAHGLAITQRTVRDGGKLVLRTELRHPAGAVLDSEVELGASASDPQNWGGSLTYLRRYELVTLLGIAAEQDRDAQDVEPPRAGGAKTELPPWAQQASRDRVGEVAGALAHVLGVDRTRALVAAVRDTYSYVPGGMVATLKLAGKLLDEALDEAGHYDLVTRERTVLEEKARKATEAERVAQAQDAAAEEPRESVPADRAHTELDDATSAAAEADEPPAGYGGGQPEPGKPAPGTVPPPEIPEEADAASQATILRGAGCICTQPMAADAYETLAQNADAAEDDDERKRLSEAAGRLRDQVNDECPLVGHGIPF